jgi:hypothetical protein
MSRAPKFQVRNTPRGWQLHVSASISETGNSFDFRDDTASLKLVVLKKQETRSGSD